MTTPTPHISAAAGDFAESVIMPGDPRRAEFIAKNWLDDAELVSDVRGIVGFTGTYKSRPTSVLASGMGIPSISIYATELARFYGVKRIVRVGTAGALSEDIQVHDAVIVSGAHTNSTVLSTFVPGVTLSAVPDAELLANAVKARSRIDSGHAIHARPVFTSDYFYLNRPETTAALAERGTAAVEMEAAGLYTVGATEGIATLAVVTISDHLITGEALTSAERETAFETSLRLALAALHPDV